MGETGNDTAAILRKRLVQDAVNAALKVIWLTRTYDHRFTPGPYGACKRCGQQRHPNP